MPRLQKATILSAPQGWGKTRNAEALRAEFGCTRVVDEWSRRSPVKAGALHLTNAHPRSIDPMTNARVVERGWS